jgi:hypothetical protein
MTCMDRHGSTDVHDDLRWLGESALRTALSIPRAALQSQNFAADDAAVLRAAYRLSIANAAANTWSMAELARRARDGAVDHELDFLRSTGLNVSPARAANGGGGASSCVDDAIGGFQECTGTCGDSGLARFVCLERCRQEAIGSLVVCIVRKIVVAMS